MFTHMFQRYRLIFSIVLTLGTGITNGYAQNTAKLVVPLEDGRYYSPNAVRQALHGDLGQTYASLENANDRVELRWAERVALRAADAAGIMNVQFRADRIVITFSDPSRSRQVAQLLQVDWGLGVPPDFDPHRHTVAVIHGLESSPAQFTGLAYGLRKQGVQVLLFDYPNDGPIALAGDRLSQDLKHLATKYPDLRLVIVGHSMGGLVARYCVEMPGKNPGCITDLIMLGTPNRGSRMAIAQPWLEDISCLFLHLPGKWTTINDGQGQAAEDLLPGSAFLTQLNGQRKPTGIHYHSAIGIRGVFTAAKQAQVVAEVDELMIRRGVAPDKRKGILKFLRSEELCHGKGDSAVTRTSATFSSATSQKEFDLTHLQLAHVPKDHPEQSEVFVWIRGILDRSY